MTAPQVSNVCPWPTVEGEEHFLEWSYVPLKDILSKGLLSDGKIQVCSPFPLDVNNELILDPENLQLVNTIKCFKLSQKWYDSIRNF